MVQRQLYVNQIRRFNANRASMYRVKDVTRVVDFSKTVAAIIKTKFYFVRSVKTYGEKLPNRQQTIYKYRWFVNY